MFSVFTLFDNKNKTKQRFYVGNKMPNGVAHLHFETSRFLLDGVTSQHARGTHMQSHFRQSFVTYCNKCPMQGEGQDSGLMGKWEMGYHQANRAPRSTNQIRKLGVCVSERETVCVCVCVRSTQRSTNGRHVLGVQSFRHHLSPALGAFPGPCAL